MSRRSLWRRRTGTAIFLMEFMLILLLLLTQSSYGQICNLTEDSKVPSLVALSFKFILNNRHRFYAITLDPILNVIYACEACKSYRSIHIPELDLSLFELRKLKVTMAVTKLLMERHNANSFEQRNALLPSIKILLSTCPLQPTKFNGRLTEQFIFTEWVKQDTEVLEFLVKKYNYKLPQ